MINKTHLCSGNSILNLLLVKNGRANMILKASSKRRKTKGELEAIKKQKLDEEQHFAQLKQIEENMRARNIKIMDVPNVFEQHQQMLQYMKGKGLIVENDDAKMN